MGNTGTETAHARFESRDGVNVLVPAAIASAAAGLVHAAVVGAHGEHIGLSRLFIVAAIAQMAVAVFAFVKPGARLAAGGLVGVNLAVLCVWILTRFVGISWIDGLQRAERPGLADSIAALLAAGAVVVALPVLLGRLQPTTRVPAAGAALLVAALAVPAMVAATDHDHDHGAADGAHDHGHGDDHLHDESRDHSEVAIGDVHDHHDDEHHDDEQHDDEQHSNRQHGKQHGDHHGDADGDHAHGDHAHGDHGGATEVGLVAPAWPRPWDPTQPIDFSGVPGVTPEQQARAEQLVADTLAELPRFADVSTVGELGFRSIGDARTGFEHYINIGYIGDEHLLDPRYPESLVYEVDGDQRTLVSAMFIASDRAVDDPELVAIGGPLMEWHVHDNLCWGLNDEGVPEVKAVTDNHGGTCPPGTVLAGGNNPMVHVWIAPHDCGPFAALEGHGAGQAATGIQQRADQCSHGHSDHGDHGDQSDHGDHGGAVPPRPYDPELPIDLSGVDGVSLQQQAFAENLVARTIHYLPQWADPAVAEAAGFRSIGDGGTGHEHYVQWDWINDDVWLDPNFPESLVFEPQPDGSKTLVSAMYMLPRDMTLADIPDWGGQLMQWHIHDDLCYTADPEAPRVAAVIQIGGECPPPLVKMDPAPMVHVWIRPHECGPFAALDGVGAGQVAAGDEHFCNHAHGAG
jgi:hypothetical protein